MKPLKMSFMISYPHGAIYRFESPLKDPAHVKKVHSVIHRSPRSRKDGTRRMKNEGMADGTRNQGHEIPDCTRDPISGLPYEGIIFKPEGFKRLCATIDAPGKYPEVFSQPGFGRVVY
ncbi:hypothetical protein TNCV_1130031 [Trichonephila clavipes]|nr:hypothetical protein TNCV_1130031 [Trichonephila clavipes]